MSAAVLYIIRIGKVARTNVGTVPGFLAVVLVPFKASYEPALAFAAWRPLGDAKLISRLCMAHVVAVPLCITCMPHMESIA